MGRQGENAIGCPLLLFIGKDYDGSIFHQCHQELVGKLIALKKNCEYIPIPGGGHNFVLDTTDAPAQAAFEIQWKFLQKHFPPAKTP